MKNIIATFAIAGFMAATATIAFAGQPENPGQFGQDRAAGVHNFQAGGSWDTGAPGASDWGAIAGERGSQNGTINRDYKDSHGGTPDHGSGK
jgi:hypothetical protein